jgi:hypothetical protein
MQYTSPVHDPQVQLDEHVRVPQLPHPWVEPSLQTPSPSHGDQTQLTVQ